MCRSDVSVIPFRMCPFFHHSLALLLWIVDPFLPVGDKFSSQMISGTVSWLLGLDKIFK